MAQQHGVQLREHTRRMSYDEGQQQKHIKDLQKQHRLLLLMSSQQRRRDVSPLEINPTRFCCPHPRPKAPLPFEVNPSESHTIDHLQRQVSSACRGLNPYIRPHRSSSLQCHCSAGNLDDSNCLRRLPTSSSISLEQRDITNNQNQNITNKLFCSSCRDEIKCVPIPNTNQSRQCINYPITRENNNTFPPYPAIFMHERIPTKSFRSITFDPIHVTGRWDEDPCLLRPNSPSIICPHNPRVSGENFDEGTCFVVGQAYDSENQHFKSSFEQSRDMDEDAYSYAGDGILSPADIIKAQASAGNDSESYGGSIASDNIYEEIPEEWDTIEANNRKSLVEEVFDEYERMRTRRLRSATNFSVKNATMTGSIVTLDFAQELSPSPDSGLTISSSQTYSEGLYDPVCYQAPCSEKVPQIPKPMEKTCINSKTISILGKPPLSKLSRCESMDIKQACAKETYRSRSKTNEMVKKNSSKVITIKTESKKEGYIRGHLRSSGRGLKLKLGGVKDKLEQSKRIILNISKKGKYIYIICKMYNHF